MESVETQSDRLSAVPNECLCNSRLPFFECCGPSLSMNLPAATCLQLMRSRFSAFRQRNSRYLLRTWHKSTRPPVGELESHWNQWVSLRIDDTTKGRVNDSHGTVSFTAFYLDGEYLRSFAEVSRFVKVDGQWFYVDGVVNVD